MGDDKLIDAMIRDGLWCALCDVHMGITAENVAEKYNITRVEQDEYACQSQQRTEKAIKEGRFSEEIIPIEVSQPKGPPIIVDTDEFPRFGTTVEKLATLKPAFKPNGTVTAGNASGINDAAASLVLVSKKKAEGTGASFLRIDKGVCLGGRCPRDYGYRTNSGSQESLS